MRKFLVLGATLATAVAAPLQAQRASTSFSLTPYAGYMFSGNILDGPLGTQLSNASGTVYGAQLGINLTDNIALIGNVARTSSSLEVGVPFLGGISVGNSSMWLYDAGLQLSLPSGALPIAPFVQVGAGAISHDISTGSISAKSTNMAYNAGLGADLSLGRNFGLRLMAKDYIGRFDIKEATQIPVEGKLAHNWALSAGLRLGF